MINNYLLLSIFKHIPRINWSRKTILYIAGTIIVLTVGSIIYFSYDPVESEFFPKCPFLTLTGLKCPGCGSQRAIHDLLHFDVMAAVKHNALMVISIPYVLLLLIAKITPFFAPSSDFPIKIQQTGVIWTIFALIIIFWITRNIFDF